MPTAPMEIPKFPMTRSSFAPPAEYAEIRARPGLGKITMPDGSWAWIATRYEDVRTVLSNTGFSTSPATPNYPMIAPARAALLINEHPVTLIRMDAPVHTKYRRMLTREFMLKVIEDLKPYIASVIDNLLDGMDTIRSRKCDFFAEFAQLVPTTVLTHVLGVPIEDRQLFHKSSADKKDLSANSDVPINAIKEIRAYIDDLITEKMNVAEPADDLITRLVRDYVVPGEMTREEAVATIDLLLLAGHETTATMIALGTLSMLMHPDQKSDLVFNPGLVGNAVEEMLRYHTVAQFNGPRVALDDVVVGSHLVRKGEGVMALINAANRDPAVFPDPDKFDIHRKGALRHVAFSYGVHQCLGQTLARAELQLVFTKLFQRFPNMQLDADIDGLPFKYNDFIYGIDSLPVAW